MARNYKKGVLNYAGDYYKGIADLGMSAVGLTDVIDQDDYSTKFFSKADKTINTAGKVGGQVAANYLLPGVGGMAMGAVQNVGGSLNPHDTPEEPYSVNPYNPKSVSSNLGMANFAMGGELTQYQGNPEQIDGINVAGQFNADHGETSMKGKNGKYMFSNKIMFDNKKTFADVSKKIEKRYSFREGDAISNKAKQRELDSLAEEQEAVRAEINGVEEMEAYAKGGWIKKAINPAHKGYCTPMTKSTCTPHRKALAMRFKHGDLHKGHAMGGKLPGYYMGGDGLDLVKQPNSAQAPYATEMQLPVQDEYMIYNPTTLQGKVASQTTSPRNYYNANKYQPTPNELAKSFGMDGWSPPISAGEKLADTGEFDVNTLPVNRSMAANIANTGPVAPAEVNPSGTSWSDIPIESKYGMGIQAASLLAQGLVLPKKARTIKAPIVQAPKFKTVNSNAAERIAQENVANSMRTARNAGSVAEYVNASTAIGNEGAKTVAGIRLGRDAQNAQIKNQEAQARASIDLENAKMALQAGEINQQEYDSIKSSWLAYLGSIGAAGAGASKDVLAYKNQNRYLDVLNASGQYKQKKGNLYFDEGTGKWVKQ